MWLRGVSPQGAQHQQGTEPRGTTCPAAAASWHKHGCAADAGGAGGGPGGRDGNCAEARARRRGGPGSGTSTTRGRARRGTRGELPRARHCQERWGHREPRPACGERGGPAKGRGPLSTTMGPTLSAPADELAGSATCEQGSPDGPHQRGRATWSRLRVLCSASESGTTPSGRPPIWPARPKSERTRSAGALRRCVEARWPSAESLGRVVPP